MKTVSMKMDAAEAKEEASPSLLGKDAPRYHWGVSLSLDDDLLTKLGLDELPKVGTKLAIEGRAVVTAVSSNTSQDGKEHRSVQLQITDLACGPIAKDGADTLYEKKGAK